MKRAEKSRKARFSLRKEHVLMSSDEDEPAPSPSATVLARRASREVKPMREESGSDEDAEEPEEWEGADETSCSEEEEGEEEELARFERGRVRLHTAHTPRSRTLASHTAHTGHGTDRAAHQHHTAGTVQ